MASFLPVRRYPFSSEVFKALMSLIFAQMFLGVCRFSEYFYITKELAGAIAQTLDKQIDNQEDKWPLL